MDTLSHEPNNEKQVKQKEQKGGREKGCSERIKFDINGNTVFRMELLYC